MFCIECGTKLKDASKFCSNCGVKIAGHVENEIATSIVTSPVFGKDIDKVESIQSKELIKDDTRPPELSSNKSKSSSLNILEFDEKVALNKFIEQVDDNCLEIHSHRQAVDYLKPKVEKFSLDPKGNQSFINPCLYLSLELNALSILKINLKYANEVLEKSTIFHAKSPDSLKMLLDYGLSINVKTDGEESILINALRENYPFDYIEYIINLGVKIDEADSNGCLPIHVCCHVRATHMLDKVKLLHQHGADLNDVGRSGATILDLADISGDKELINYALSNGGVRRSSAIKKFAMKGIVKIFS